MYSTDIRDYEDKGLNADWCLSAYYMNPDWIIFDCENSTFELCHIEPVLPYGEVLSDTIHSGTFKQCVDFFMENIKENK